ncbi:MAG TPA: DUF1553 domain-containing protein [Thermoanaerobaculia bacterium]|jgi:hypothetical protein|nr:DUF1553 domain-containing protein [Thermoanaerobaculia bacterium]
MRSAKLTGTLLALVVSCSLGAQEAPAPSADCTFNAMKLRSPRETYHQLSLTTELVSPSPLTAQATATAPGRRRPSQPPKASTPPAPRNFIDAEIFGKMVKDGVQWTARSSDAEFLRRVTLDLTGEIPDGETVKAFLADPDSNKRDKTIDRLLNSPAFTDRWTMWFGDHIQNVQFAQNTSIFPEGRDAYGKYIRESIASGKPYDVMVRELISGSGSNMVNGEANYWARQIQSNGPLQDTYDNLAAFTGQKFLGLPMICLSCHGGLGHLELVNSGLAKRTRGEFWKSAAFFAQVSSIRSIYSSEALQYRVQDLTVGEYNLNTTSGNKTPRAPDPGQPATAAPAFFLTGEQPAAGEPRRAALGRMLTAHPQFARATVNYLWKEIFGAGIVEPADSFDLQRQDPASLPAGAVLQPTHPQLLNQLADSFRQNGFNLRELLRLMVSSNAYQLSSRYTPGAWNESWTPYYARHYPRRLMAEEVLDAIFRATNVGGTIFVSTGTPVTKAMQIPDPWEGGEFYSFLNNFGRGNRDDDERSSESSIVQALALMNNRVVTSRVSAAANGSVVKTLVTKPESPATIAESLYLATLSRYPTAAEKAAAVAYLNGGTLSKKTEDLQFALLNRIEFLFN